MSNYAEQATTPRKPRFQGCPYPEPSPRARSLPLILDAAELARLDRAEDLLVVDVRRPETCIDGHIPGAVSLVYQDLLRENGYAKGLLPDMDRLSFLLSGIGLSSAKHVIAYDDDAGAGASRLLWTLDVLGHHACSLLNGGFAAWDEAGLPVTEHLTIPAESDYCAFETTAPAVDYDHVLAQIGNPGVVLLDARSAEEYSGTLIRAARGGHIPGAVHFDWSQAVDLHDNHRLRSRSQLQDMMSQRGITPEKEVIVYCHTHHRSSHTYIMLKHLGYERVRAYAGSWSEWGNRPDAPLGQ